MTACCPATVAMLLLREVMSSLEPAGGGGRGQIWGGGIWGGVVFLPDCIIKLFTQTLSASLLCFLLL